MYISSLLDICLGGEGRLIQVSHPPWHSIQGKEEGFNSAKANSFLLFDFLEVNLPVYSTKKGLRLSAI